MAHLALYRSYRPQTFGEIVGQEQVVVPLQQSILRQEIGHAYLFAGTRGTGKTSIAKIFSRAVNCLNPQNGSPCNQCEICKGLLDGSLLDVIEFDAASNTGVDYMRRIVEEVLYQPIQAKYKVYIIDEAHMLSNGAFNALLKTLEEPPSHIIFIFATTEVTKLPATIISRCQRYQFPRIPTNLVCQHLRYIADQNNIAIDDNAIATIATLSEGAMRDAISLLDQVQYGGNELITRQQVLHLAGQGGDLDPAKLSLAVVTGDLASILQLVEQLFQSGAEANQIAHGVLRIFRHAMVLQVAPNQLNTMTLTDEVMAIISEITVVASSDLLVASITALAKQMPELRLVRDPRTVIEIILLGMSRKNNTLPRQNSEVVVDVACTVTPPAQPKPKLQPQPQPATMTIETLISKPLEQPPVTPTPQPTCISDENAWQRVLDRLSEDGSTAYYCATKATAKLEGNLLTVTFAKNAANEETLMCQPTMRDELVMAVKAALGQDKAMIIATREKEPAKPNLTPEQRLRQLNQTLDIPTK